MTGSSRRGPLVHVVLLVATLASVWASSRLRLSNDLTDLFPKSGEATTLTRFLRAFGGGDLAVFLVEGEATAVAAAAATLESTLKGAPSVARVLPHTPTQSAPDPTLAWLFAGPRARERLAEAVTPAGMRARLQGTRELLLAPGAADEALARDPLRLGAIPFEDRLEVAAGVVGRAGDPFVTADGGARLVVVEPRGSAFEGDRAEAFMADAERAIASAGTSVRVRVTGGHAIAAATASMLRRDMIASSVLSSVLASVVFLVTFGRFRALFAVLPPLALGTAWTMGLAFFFPGGLSAIATAFGAVVLGVGVDTGVHLYAALLDARRRGLTGADAKRDARRQTARPTLLAALAAGLAFASLALSDLSAVRQLGLLCAAGELLTAVAILVVLPEIGERLERRSVATPPTPHIAGAIAHLTRTPRRAAVALALALVALPALAFTGLPQANDVLVAIRPKALEPLHVQKAIYERFGSREGQWLVVSAGRDEAEAAARADRVAETLERLREGKLIDGFDALAPLLPSEATQRARLAERDKLDLPGKKAELERALDDMGFDREAVAPALSAFAAPSHVTLPVDRSGPLGFLVSRHLARDEAGALGVSYVRPLGEREADGRALAALTAAAPATVVTGYHHLEHALRDALARDLPRVSLVALALVLASLRALLGRAVDVAIAATAVVVELAWVALAMKALGLRVHVYDALVVPVLIGITMDESMFLLFAARREGARIEDALAEQGPLVASTALTTAVGFGALLVCRFEGLRDLGAVGALGSSLGLLSALVVVPAALRLLGARRGAPA